MILQEVKKGSRSLSTNFKNQLPSSSEQTQKHLEQLSSHLALAFRILSEFKFKQSSEIRLKAADLSALQSHIRDANRYANRLATQLNKQQSQTSPQQLHRLQMQILHLQESHHKQISKLVADFGRKEEEYCTTISNLLQTLFQVKSMWLQSLQNNQSLDQEEQDIKHQAMHLSEALDNLQKAGFFQPACLKEIQKIRSYMIDQCSSQKKLNRIKRVESQQGEEWSQSFESPLPSGGSGGSEDVVPREVEEEQLMGLGGVQSLFKSHKLKFVRQ